MADILIYITLALATYRLSVLLVREDGPFDILAKFRYFIGVRYDQFSKPVGSNVFSKLIVCVWCTSIWVGLLFSLLSPTSTNFVMYLSTALAFSSVAITIDWYAS